MKILLYDLEITPILGWSYGIWNTNIIEVERSAYIMCFSYMWYGEKKKDIKCISQIDFPSNYKSHPYDDGKITKKLHELLEEADIVIAHNAKGFDNKVAMGRMIYHNMLPPSPFATIDTLTVFRSKFKFSSNSLDKLGQELKIGRKTKTTHGKLWRDCVGGDRKAWAKMIRYCKQDVWLLHNLYERARPYISNHPNISHHDIDICPRCGSRNLHYRGYRHTNTSSFRRIQCMDCGGWTRERLHDKNLPRPKYVNI
jgi:DNA polymerase elongation subunit (family B)